MHKSCWVKVKYTNIVTYDRNSSYAIISIKQRQEADFTSLILFYIFR